MATQLQLRRGTTAENMLFTGAEGEVTVDTEKHTLIVHDGVTRGGAREIGGAGSKVNITFTGDVTGQITNFDMSQNVSVALTASETLTASPMHWYVSTDHKFGYLGSVAGATCVFNTNSIGITLPQNCVVSSMFIAQAAENITSSTCTINFDVSNVMTSATPFDVDSLATLCSPLPYVQVFQLADNGLQDNRSGVSQINTAPNTVVLSGLKTGDDRVFKLLF